MSDTPRLQRQFLTFRSLLTPPGIDGKLVIRAQTILGLEPVGDDMNASLLRVSFPVYSGEGQPMPGYIIKGSPSTNYKRISEAFYEAPMDEPSNIDIAH